MPPKADHLKSSKRNKKIRARSDGTTSRQTAAVQMDEQLHPADLKRRERVMEVTRERYEQEVKDAFKHLDELCPGKGSKRTLSKQDKTKALSASCQKYTDDNFPNIGTVAYAVPHFFIGKHSLKPDKDGLFFQHTQESDVRGDNAQSKVGRGLRLLSEEMEKNGDNTMFTIGNILYEQVLIWPDATSEARENSCPLQKYLLIQYPHLFADKGRYYTRGGTEDGRGEPDIVILHKTKGVIIIQVKAFGTHRDPKGTKTKTKAVKQLEIDEEVFHNLFQHDNHLKTLNVCKVFALPNLTEKEANTRCKISEKDGVNLLCKDNLFGDDMEKAEAEYSLQKLKDWWNKLPDNPISLESIKDIVARFV
ncbi:uncharacterized protein [Littorina saxatilis]|uniref:uncharacterized protein n=1 Tax=Littorina saxatilis TaxID=31220 RepID=UPI0038B54329